MFRDTLCVSGSIVRSAKCRYLSYRTERAILRAFCPAGATCCTEGGEIWHRRVDQSAKFNPHRCKDSSIEHQKLKIY